MRLIRIYLIIIFLTSAGFVYDSRQDLSGTAPKTVLLYAESVPEETIQQIRNLQIEIISWVRNNLYILATEAERDLLKERGLQFDEIMEGDDELTFYKRAMYGEDMILSDVYHTYDRILGVIDDLIRRYPNLISKEIIGQTQQGRRDIYAVKISNQVNNNPDRPTILFTGAIHSRELATPEICLELIKRLVTGYGTDTRMTEWLELYEIYVIPVINVDGHYIVTQNLDPRWRKNARGATDDWESVSYPMGIDLNRNYDFNFAGGGSGDPESIRYRGEYPFSESEVRAVRSLVERIRPVLSINYHSQGEVIFYPWVWRGMNAPDDKLLTDIAQGIADQIVTMDGEGTYDIAYGAGLVGQSYPWLYGRYGTFDFIVETGRGAHVFPPEEIPGIVEANIPGAYYLLERGKGPGLTGRVTDAGTGEALDAVVWFPSIESEEVDRRTTKPGTGRYHRLLCPGTYYMIVMCDGYETKVFPEVEVIDGNWTEFDIQLNPR
jgi:carboxypeptidase T